MNNNSPSEQRGWSRYLALASLTLLTLPVMAQQANTSPDPGSDEEPVKLEKFVVTGSYIPVAADSGANPVTMINAEDIGRSGITTNPLDVLRKTIPQFTGSGNIGAENANIASGSTGGGSVASLRNLTTLTLINGRRAAASPIQAVGGLPFVDLNIIPLAAIDSIEVLLDGASATYGTDATSGVVNVKTKSNYGGAEVGGFYEWADSPEGWSVRGANFTVGAGNGRTNVTVSGTWSRQDPLWQFEREYSNPQYGTATFGGVINFGGNFFVLNPSLSAPPVGAVKPTVAFPMAASPVAPGGAPYFGAVGSNAVYWGKVVGGNIVGFGSGELASANAAAGADTVAFNLSNYVTILQRRESRGFITTYDHKFNDAVQLFGDIMYSSVRTMSQINAQPLGAVATPAQVDNPFNNTFVVRNRFVTNPRQYFFDTEFFRFVGGFRGDINERLSYETAINLGSTDLAYRNPGVVDAAAYTAAIGTNPVATTTAGRLINVFRRNVPPADVRAANFVGTAYNNFRSSLRSIDGRVLYKAAELPAGDLNVVIGGEFRKETLSGTADLNSIPDEFGNIGWTGATSVNPFKAARDISSVFVEALIPLASPQQNLSWARSFDLDVAFRHEKYSDTDDPTVPKVTLRWQPFNDEFMVRATYGESFVAPTLYTMFGPSDVGFSPEVNVLPFGQPDVPANYVTGQSNARTQSNPGLEPATSKSMTVGFVWSPKSIKGLELEVGYWKIDEENIVGFTAAQDILQDVETRGPNSQFVAGGPGYNPIIDVRLAGYGAQGAPITAPGQVAVNFDNVYLVRSFQNIATQKAEGIDVGFRFRRDVAGIGNFSFASNIAYWINYEAADVPLAGSATAFAASIPRWLSSSSIAWTRGDWDAFITNRFVPAIDAPEEVSGKTEAEQYTTFDIGVGYRFDNASWAPKFLKGLHVTLTVKNAGDEHPPQLPTTFSNDSVDTSIYDPVGRSFVVSAQYKF